MARHLTKQQKTRIIHKRNEKIEALDLGETPLYKGRVITQHGAHITLESEDYTLYQANVRQNLGSIICGDYVQFIFEQNAAIVVNVLARKNRLSRLGFGGREKLLAANLDQVLIILAPKPEPSPSLVDRYLIAIRQFDVPIVLVINKYDLLEEPAVFDFVYEYQKIFGYAVLPTCINDAAKLAQLAAALTDKTSILVGQSGVGKSSLTNKLIPELDLQTQKISATTGLGNHTTSSSTLYHLPKNSGAIIDSPGVRSFNIEHLSLAAVQEGFPDLIPHTFACRFRNCRHLQDPGCALTEALKEKTINQRRVDSYLQIIASL